VREDWRKGALYRADVVAASILDIASIPKTLTSISRRSTSSEFSARTGVASIAPALLMRISMSVQTVAAAPMSCYEVTSIEWA
jgi:hypothetical protein